MKDLKTIITLFRATDSFSKAIQKDVKQYGLNVTEFGVLEALYHKGKMSIKELLEKVLITNSSMSYVVNQLTNKSYIKKTRSNVDGRSFECSLTNHGKKLMEKTYQEHLKNMRKIIDVLSLDEEEKLRDMLKRIGKKANEFSK